jgi:hypothetical protein
MNGVGFFVGARRVAVFHPEPRVVHRVVIVVACGVAIAHPETGVVNRVGLAIRIALAVPRALIVRGACSAARFVGGAIRFHLLASGVGFFTCFGASAPRNVGRLAIGAPLAARDSGVIEADRIAQLVELELRELARVSDS